MRMGEITTPSALTPTIFVVLIPTSIPITILLIRSYVFLIDAAKITIIVKKRPEKEK